ncbi:hypothetical protein ACFQ08_43750, partial [Streptosporangium algeriense]
MITPMSLNGRCPSCSASLPIDPRFVVWCPECDWNADPTAEQPVAPATWFAKLTVRRRARREAAE